MMVEIAVAREDAGQRADRFLRRRLPHLSGSRLQSLFRRKEIKVGKAPILPAQVLAPGDTLRVYGLKEEEASPPAHATDSASRSAPAAALPPVLFEDDALLVLDKPAGLAVHPGTGIEPGRSAIEAVWARETDGWGDAVFRPSLVHRLDKETSGVLLVAKTAGRLRELHAALRGGRLRKEYLALVRGRPHPPEGTLDAALQRTDAPQGAKMRPDAEAGLAAVTHYRTLENCQSHTLLRVIIETGRMHQIRAHLAGAGHPLAGDGRYGRFEDARGERKTLGLKRHFLHAHRLIWETESAPARTFTAPLPADLSAVLGRLGLRGPD